MPCPPEIPQAVCAALDAILTAQPPPPKPPEAPPWGSADIAVTLQQWVAAMSKTAPSVPPTLPPTPADLATNQYATLLGAAVDFWKNVGARDPGAATKIDPRTWQLPWQYAVPTVTTVPDAIGTMLAGIMSDPDPAARAQILRGQIPTFRPEQMGWGQRAAQPFWGGTNTIPAVSSAGAFVQPLQDFITRGNQCGLFNTTPAAVQQAWADYIAFGVDACSKLQPAPGDPKVPLPELPPTSKTTTTAAPSSSNALAIGLAVGGAALIGGLVWALSKRSSSAPSYMAEETSADVHRRVIDLRRRATRLYREAVELRLSPGGMSPAAVDTAARGLEREAQMFASRADALQRGHA